VVDEALARARRNGRFAKQSRDNGDMRSSFGELLYSKERLRVVGKLFQELTKKRKTANRRLPK
jgi:hypothetical protein